MKNSETKDIQSHSRNTVLSAAPLDADGQRLYAGDRVYAYDIDGRTRVYGTLLPNDDYKDVAEWYVEYDDGAECAVLDFGVLWKA